MAPAGDLGRAAGSDVAEAPADVPEAAAPAWESRVAEDAGLTHSLDLLRDTYNYNHWVYALCRPWLGEAVLEVGAGIGNLTQFLLGARRVVCVEPEAEYQPRLQAMAEVHRNLEVHGCPVQEIPPSVRDLDSALCVNVLEHIRDDGEALALMAARVRPGGAVVLYVPAVPWAYGEMDARLGHFRRYRKSDLRALARRTGMDLVRLRHVNFIGLLGWWWAGRVRKEAVIDPGKARVMDRLVPYVSAVERLIPPLAGQSLLAVFRKN